MQSLKLIVPMIVIALSSMLTGCSGPSAAQDADFKNLLTTANEMFDILGTVKAPDDVAATKPKLDDLFQRVQEAHGKFQALPAETRQQLFKKYDAEIGGLNRKLVDQLRRTDAPKGLPLTYGHVFAKELGKEMTLRP